MAHQMTDQTKGPQMTPPPVDQSWSGDLEINEPRWDETRYSQPGMPPYYATPQNWEMSPTPQNWGPGMPMPGAGGGNYGSGPSSSFEQSQRMKNPVDMETTHNPTNSSDAYQASLRSLLARNVGYFIAATFLTGTQRMVTWQGILHTVGSDYIVIYQPDYERYISCDFYALKFVQFHNTRNTPFCASSHTWMAQDT